jgi:pantetheine-phosphate adenylyltransferase
MKKAIYAGTFDPITKGHIDIIQQSLTIFDEVIIGIATSSSKKPMFSIDKRVEMVKKSIIKFEKKIIVKPFSNLLVDFAKENQVKTIIRGIRNNIDFEYELQLNYANQSLDNQFQTVFFIPNLQNSFISSSIIRSIIQHQGSINHLVPNEVLEFCK